MTWKSLQDDIVMMATGIYLILTGIVGLALTVAYDQMVHRPFHLGINAWKGIIFFIVAIIIGAINIRMWYGK